MEKETSQITVGPQEMRDAAALYQIMSAARQNPQGLAALGGVLSHTPRRPRGFMAPEAAQAFAREFGADLAKQYLGNRALRESPQIFAQPTAGDVHVDAILTSISVAYRNEEHIGALVIPRVQVTKRSDLYFIWDKANLRNDATERAPGARARSTGHAPTTGTYLVKTESIEHQIPDEVRQNTDSPLDADRDGAMFVGDVLDLKYEKQAASLIQTSANWTTNATLSGTGQWSDYSNSTPFTDLKTARITILQQTARKANTLQLGYEVFETLALHPDLLDRVKYTGTGDRPAMVTAQMMAALFMVDQVVVGSAIENTANEGQTDSLSFVWGKHAWLAHVPAGASLNTPAAAYGFTRGRILDRYREDATKSDYIRAEEAWDMRAVAAGAGYRIVNAIA